MGSKLTDINACLIIPTYNNENTLRRVIDGALVYGSGHDIFVVNDGSTDSTEQILESYKNQVTVLSYPKNVGKGNALKVGFREAIKQGFTNAITIDSDGQHYPDDIPVFIAQALKHPGALLMGSRNMEQEGVPSKSSFGNKFSNFWYKLETGIELPDTQTGYRLYPLEPLKKIRLLTNKFEMEIELIVKMAWKGVEVLPVQIKVLYDPDERVTHFRPFQDFTRISILNTYFVILTFLYYLPKRLILAATKKEFWKKVVDDIVDEEESSFRKSLAIGFGFFMGIFPIWGFQLLIGIPLAIFFRLNKALFITTANISVPPMIPVLIWISYYCGGLFFGGSTELPDLENITLETIHLNVMQYYSGAVVFAIIAGLVGFSLSYPLLVLLRGKR